MVVRQALERQALIAEKQRLEALTRCQNEDLRTLNESLERKVEERAAELHTANESLTFANVALNHANAKLEQNFLTSIRVFTNLIDLRGGRFAGRSRRVADLARKIATRIGLDEHDAQEVYVAGLLNDIGKIGLPDDLLGKPLQQMSDQELAIYRKHPAFGQHALMPLQDLRGAAIMIRGQHERYDGSGFPDRLPGVQIPLGARILAVAGDFDYLQTGALGVDKLSPDEARDAIRDGSGNLYDPRVVEAFLDVLNGTDGSDAPDMRVDAAQLRPGMVLSRDLISRDGLLLLSAGYKLNEQLIEQISKFDRTEGGWLAIHVLAA